MPTAKTYHPRRLTLLQEERAERDRALTAEWDALTAAPRQSRTEALRFLMDKYHVHSSGTLYTIINRTHQAAQAQTTTQQ